jgi:tetratricopeptide (TPR) repeat protein
MTSTRLLYNDDEYIDGLLESSPAIIDAIYRQFAKKVSSFILQHGGNKKDAAHIFEVALTDIYGYARRHPIELTARFEPFFMLICKIAWRKELQRRGMDVREEAEAEIAALDNTHLKYVREIVENGEKKRCWVQLYYQLTPACQNALQKALIRPVADGAGTNPQPTAGLAPELSAPCMVTLIKSSLTQRSGKELFPGNIEQAALYVMNELAESEKQTFDQQLKEQAALQEIVEQGREAIEWLRRTLTPDNTKRELMQILADMRLRWFYGKERDNSRMGWYVMGIAVFAMLIASLLFISPWRKDVYRQFAPTEMVHHHIPNNDTSRILHEASRNFNRRRFAAAVQQLNRVLELHPSNSFARYYRGVCLVEMNQQALARADLQAVYEGNEPFRFDAAFYMALSFLKERDKQQALEWLLKIPPQAAVYTKAQKMLEELR